MYRAGRRRFSESDSHSLSWRVPGQGEHDRPIQLSQAASIIEFDRVRLDRRGDGGGIFKLALMAGR
jgi:hypothetical protein